MKKFTTIASLHTALKAFGWVLMAGAALTFGACSDDDDNSLPQEDYGRFMTAATVNGNTEGMYIIGEGNYQGNNSQLDYLDFGTGWYYPNVMYTGKFTKGIHLGDTGQDLKLYNGKLWLVINGSNKVEVIDRYTGKIEGEISIPNPRSLAYANGYVYVTAYVQANFGSAAQKGAVYKINERNLNIEGSVQVGYQPEGIEVLNDSKLYVANSGGYVSSTIGYEHSISVIDLNTFTVTNTIDTGSNAINLNKVAKDRNNNLWVTAIGNYGSTPGCIVKISNDQVVSTIQKAVTGFVFNGNNLIYYSQPYGSSLEVGTIDINNATVTNTHLLQTNNPSELPTAAYGIAQNPDNGDIYITDAKDYTSAGAIFVYDKDGKYKTTIANETMGISPSHICFVTR